MLLLSALQAPVLAAEIDPSAEIPLVTIVGLTPLPGLELRKEQIPGAVQTASAREIEKSGALDLSDFLNRSLGSVHINEAQSNPFMIDVNYRGYTASPLLGTPQGLSVYLDGVRMNQPFGDVVMWDLIPKAAIASVNLMSGANPLFGLNTLGGALSIRTKDGLSDPGTALEVSLGSYGRMNVSLEHGGSNDKGMDWYMTANAYQEGGWRDNSASLLGQFFGKLGWHDAKSALKLSYAYAAGNLSGNGMQESQLLESRYSSVYTKPDITKDHASFLNLEGQTSLSEKIDFSGNIYYRNTRTNTINADLNENSLAYSPANGNSDSQTVNCIDEANQNGAPNEACNGLLTSSSRHQKNLGLSGQFMFKSEAPGVRNQAVIGAAYDASRINYVQASQFGYLNADRSLTLVNAFADGTQNSESAFDQRVNLDGKVDTASVFASDTLSLNDVWNLTLSARYNRTRLKNTDNLYPYNNATINADNLRGALDGDYVFQRLNPAVGVTYAPSHNFNVYAGYSESSRAPTSIELGCADPAFGCRLPNAMAGDPFLNQVVSKTWEAGLRGKLAHRTSWDLGVFRGNNYNDIMFVANSASTGYFKNFGQTRRQGIEAGLSSAFERLSIGANYTYLLATYQSQDSLSSQYNSTADANQAITVHPGDALPLTPKQIFKAHLDYQFNAVFAGGVQLIAIGNSLVRGNENNAHVADNITSFGSGMVPAYAVLNLTSNYKPTPGLKLFVNVNNVFNRAYATTGQLGPYAFTANGGYTNSNANSTTFYSPGAPRTFVAGARYVF